jgi:hypothetical protein
MNKMDISDNKSLSRILRVSPDELKKMSWTTSSISTPSSMYNGNIFYQSLKIVKPKAKSGGKRSNQLTINKILNSGIFDKKFTDLFVEAAFYNSTSNPDGQLMANPL